MKLLIPKRKDRLMKYIPWVPVLGWFYSMFKWCQASRKHGKAIKQYNTDNGSIEETYKAFDETMFWFGRISVSTIIVVILLLLWMVLL